MEELWSLHSDFGDGEDGCYVGVSQDEEDDDAMTESLPRSPGRDASSFLPCPECGCGMPFNKHHHSREDSDDIPSHHFAAADLTPSFASHSSAPPPEIKNSNCSFELLSDFTLPDAELIVLINQLQSERLDLIVSEKRYAEQTAAASAPEATLSVNGWCSSSSHPPPPVTSPAERRQSKSSARRKLRIQQIDLELNKLNKLRQLQTMEERAFRQSTRSSKGTRSVSTAMTPGSSVARDSHSNSFDMRSSTSGHSLDIRSTVGTAQQPELLLSTLSTLFDVDKEKITEVLTRQCMSRDQCFLLYQQNIIPVVIRLIHDPMCGISTSPLEIREKAGTILYQLVSCQPDDKRGRREGRVLNWLEEIRAYSAAIIHPNLGSSNGLNGDSNIPDSALQYLRKNSSDEEYRHAICSLGGLNAVAEFLQCDLSKFDNTNDTRHVSMRQYACMILTNLSYGDGCNKALLCSSESFLRTLVQLLASPTEELRWSVASVVRNISWRADVTSKRSLRNSKMVTALLRAAMLSKTEHSLKILLLALSNMSGHNDENRQEICAFDGALAFLVRNLQCKKGTTYEVQEQSGCILRSVSYVIAVRPDYRKILRENHCLEILVDHLRSTCIPLTANACGILWNLSARCVEDQKRLWELDAVKLLEPLCRNTHDAIAKPSTEAVRNLKKAHEGLGGAAWKSSARSGGVSARLRDGLARHQEDHAQSADDMAADYEHEHLEEDNRSYPRTVTSVPSSPLISARSARTNGSYRSVANMQSNGRTGSDRRDLMAGLVRSVGGGEEAQHTHRNGNGDHHQRSALPLHQLSSPPLSPHKQQQQHTFPQHHQHHQQSGFGSDKLLLGSSSWDPGLGSFEYSQQPQQPQQQETDQFEGFPSYAVNTQHHHRSADQMPEEESNDECIDFGARPNAETTADSNHHIELEACEDTIKHFNSETSPYMETGSSTLTSNRGAFEDLHRPFSPKLTPFCEPPSALMTPAVGSRRSTPSALSDVETVTGDDDDGHEVMDKQSVYSGFSRLQSGLVTPTFSEIPGSPSLMQMSPRVQRRRILPAPPVERQDMMVKASPPPPDVVPAMYANNNATAISDGPDELQLVGGLVNSLRRRPKKERQGAGFPLSRAPPPIVSESVREQRQDVVAQVRTLPAFLPNYCELEGVSEDTVKTFASEGLSNGTSMNSLAISALSGLSILGQPMTTAHQPGPSHSTPLPPPVPPKPSELSGSARTSADRLKFFSPTPETETAPLAFVEQEANAAAKKEIQNEPDPIAPEQSDLTAEMPVGFNFKWPIPPPLPRRISSLPASPSFSAASTAMILSPSLPEALRAVPEKAMGETLPTGTIGNNIEQPEHDLVLSDTLEQKELSSPLASATQTTAENLERSEGEEENPPPLPAPFIPTAAPLVLHGTTEPEKSLEDAVVDLETSVLVECIYGILPKKKVKGGKKGAAGLKNNHTSARKAHLQSNLSGNGGGSGVALKHSESTGLAKVDAAVEGNKGCPSRSQSSQLLGNVRGSVEDGDSQPALREKLTLPITEKAQPESGEEKRNGTASGGTSMWIDLNGGGQPPVGKLQHHLKRGPRSRNGAPQPVSGKDNGDIQPHKIEATRPNFDRVPSPDVFDAMSQMGGAAGLASHFSSEASDGEDHSSSGFHQYHRGPRIVKPGVDSKGSSNLPVSGVDADRLTSPKPIKGGGGKKPPRIHPTVNNGQSHSARGYAPNSDEILHAASNRLVKQGTFIKESESTSMALPWIFPDNDLSQQNPAVRQRYASITRLPRESSSSMNINHDNSHLPRHKSGGDFRSRSARSLSRPTPNVPLTAVSGNEALSTSSTGGGGHERPPHIEKSASVPSPKPQQKKSIPVASKIASLWNRGDKKESKNGSKSAAMSIPGDAVAAAGKKDIQSGGGVPPPIKSPTLSERLKPSRFLSIAPRMTSTLPKKIHHKTALPTASSSSCQYNGSEEDCNHKNSGIGSKKVTLV